MKRFASLLGVLILSFSLTGCLGGPGPDPFERLPEGPVEVIYGELFPFSVSVSTRATHRLEREGKLVGYLTSDLVRLEDFEGQMVELEGVWRNEKMREIFWVEAVQVAGVQTEAETIARFTTKNFTFQYPVEWDYTESPDAKLYFVDKNDPARRVFLTLSIEDFSPEAADIEPNFVLDGIAGTKTVTPQENGREQETIVLYSNDGTQQYIFKADYAFDDFDTKRALLDLLESFVEGEEQVTTVLEGEKIKQAEAEAAKLAEQSEREQLEAKARLVDEVVESDDPSFLDRLLGRGEEREQGAVSNEPVSEISEQPAANTEQTAEPDVVEEAKEALQEVVSAEAMYDYTNLIDARAYPYTSQALGYTVKTPYNHWYQNFGATSGNRWEMGFADSPIDGRASIDFWLRSKDAVQPAQPTATVTDGVLTIIKAWPSGGVLEISGPEAFKDAMWSVWESVESL